jgi:hypothetical protein
MKKILLGIMTVFVFGIVGLGVIKVAGSFSKAQAATACIITLFGQQYDVASLQTSHTGGNIFACGTDMTATYQAQHGTNVTRMIPYLVVASTPTPTSVPVPTSTPTPTSVPVTPTSTPLPTSTPTVTPIPTVVPLPNITQAPTQTVSHDDEDENETDEVEQEVRKQGVEVHSKAEVKKRNDDNDGRHLVGVNSAHGIMDNTLKKDR